MINHAGQINITHLVQLGYKPGRLIDIWQLHFGRQAIGCCMWCQTAIHPMRIMRKCAKIAGCYPTDAECFIVIDAVAYPGVEQIQLLSHRQRASLAGLVCQSCWITIGGGQTLIIPPPSTEPRVITLN